MNWWRYVMAMEIRKILAYRSDFWVTFLGQVGIQLIIATALWKNIFDSQGVSEMKGFTLPMITLYSLISPLGMRILTGENIGFISREIYEGTFTRYLIYPISVFQYKTLTYLTYSLFYALQLILLFTLYQLFVNPEAVSFIMFTNLITGTLLFLLAAMAYVMMATLIELISLWADNIWAIMVMLRFFTSFFGGGILPLTFFPEWGKNILALTPFPYFVSLPVKTVMGQTTNTEVINGSLILIFWIFFFASTVFLAWRKGQKNYAGVGV